MQIYKLSLKIVVKLMWEEKLIIQPVIQVDELITKDILKLMEI